MLRLALHGPVFTVEPAFAFLTAKAHADLRVGIGWVLTVRVRAWLHAFEVGAGRHAAEAPPLLARGA